MSKKGIVWFRLDLRLHDNEAIHDALKQCDKVYYVYVFDPRIWEGKTSYGFEKTGPFRKKFVLESIEDLSQQLESKGGQLITFIGQPEDILPQKAREWNVSWVFCNRERTQEEVDVQSELESRLWSIGRELRFSRGKMLYHTADLPFPVTHTPDQFTSFRKEVEKLVEVRVPLDIPDQLNSARIPELRELPVEEMDWPKNIFRGGTQAGMERMDYFFYQKKALSEYKETRNGLLGYEFSSCLSPWLAQGCLSPKLIFHEVKKYEEKYGSNDSTYWFFFELLWRDFFRLMAKKHGNSIFQKEGYHDHPRMVGSENWDQFDRWARGRTGVDIIDASMKQLNEVGWISNRARQWVASYLVNDLKVNWLMGAEYFESLLIDYDVASNYGNWAYIAGVGSDPRKDRYFNPESQAKRYDPDGEFVRFWLSEEESK